MRSTNKAILDTRIGWIIASADFTAVAFRNYLIDTSLVGITVTLPALANPGDEINFSDAALGFATHNLVLNRNGLKINSGTSNFTSSTNGSKISCIYVNSTIGWSVK